MSKIPDVTIVAWGIDLGTTNSTLCRTTLPTGTKSPTEPEVLSLRQSTSAGEFTGTLLPSIVAPYQGREGIGEAAQGNVVITRSDLFSGRSATITGVDLDIVIREIAGPYCGNCRAAT